MSDQEPKKLSRGQIATAIWILLMLAVLLYLPLREFIGKAFPVR